MKPNKSILINFITVFICVLVGWFLIIAPYSKVKDIIQQLPTWANSTLTEYYPADLTVSIKNGIVSMSKTSPYCLILPFKNANESKIPSGIVIDINATADVSALETGGIYSKICQPIALVGEDFVLYPDKDNTYKYTKISNTLNAEINRESVANFVNKYLPYVATLGQRAYFIIPFIVIPLLFLCLLSQNYWYSLVVKFTAKIFKTKIMTFGESYKLSLFFYNFILLIDWVIVRFVLGFLLKQNISISFPFLNTIVITAASIIYLKKTTPETPITPTVIPTEVPIQQTPIETQLKSTSIPTGQ